MKNKILFSTVLRSAIAVAITAAALYCPANSTAQNNNNPNIAFISSQRGMNEHFRAAAENARLKLWFDKLSEQVAARKMDSANANKLYQDEKIKKEARLFSDVRKATDEVYRKSNIDLLIDTSLGFDGRHCVLLYTSKNDITPIVSRYINNLRKTPDTNADRRIRNVAVIDVNKVLENHTERRAELSRIETLEGTRMSALNARKSRLGKIRKNTVMYRALANDVKKEEEEIRELVSNERKAMETKHLASIRLAINGVTSSQKFDLVLDKSFSIKNKKPVFYVSPNVNDITSQVSGILSGTSAATDFRASPAATAVIDTDQATGPADKFKQTAIELARAKNIDLVFDRSVHSIDNELIDENYRFVVYHTSDITDLTTETIDRLSR